MPDSLISIYRSCLDHRGWFTVAYEAEPLIDLVKELQETHPDVQYVVSPIGRSGFEEIIFLPSCKGKILTRLQNELSIRMAAISTLNNSIAKVESIP